MTNLAKVIFTILIILMAGAFFWWWGRVPATEAPTDTPPAPVEEELIRVSTPTSNARVQSPLTITGEARGNWYFEASFPVKILDANGVELGVSYAEAQGEWMTTEFVPFISTLTFATSTTATGTLVLEKDNPSGLPEYADEIRLPIRFQ